MKIGFHSSLRNSHNPRLTVFALATLLLPAILAGCRIGGISPEPLEIKKGTRIALIGGNLGSRMMNYGYFETEMHLRYPDSALFIRNMCDGGDTPGFRPHASRNSPWAFPGAEAFETEFAANSQSEGHFETPDQWLTRLKTDVIVAFFGYSSSFEGVDGLDSFKAELDAFIKHTLAQRYNGQKPVELVIVSPIAFEDLSASQDLPDGKEENERLKLYTEGMKEVCGQNQVRFINAFGPSLAWYSQSEDPLTIDGSQLNDAGYQKFSRFLADQLTGGKKVEKKGDQSLVLDAVREKNWMWHHDYKIPNGVHAYGRRFNPFGPDNYPYEIEKTREMTDVRDQAIWLAASRGIVLDLDSADQRTLDLPEVETNYKPGAGNGEPEYLFGQAALEKIKPAPGYRIELFASEVEFPDLAKPVHISFDNQGRLWVATIPSYPHYRPGDPKPNDKILILEDTDGDGKADKQTVFADKLHLPLSFEIAPEGVYVSGGTNLLFLSDTDGDDRADKQEILLSGFDDHDTHHNISAFVADPSGAIYMGEGVFLHSNVETSYGTVRATNGGFFRYNPRRHHLERTAQVSIPNPWGIAFDRWGQPFFAETSGPAVRWMLPGTGLPRYAEANPKGEDLIEPAHRVRPTSGLEFVSSRHFPEEVQGDLLINNTIGFLGMKQHIMEEDGTGFKSHHRQDLFVSDDRNFRPVDMEFAPDGSLYFVDWHNVLIGHMQHNARDPLRDHKLGRIYRITYPSRPLVRPPYIAGAPLDTLLENLKLPEDNSRYRTRRELRGRDVEEVLPRLKTWWKSLDTTDPDYEHHLVEALWVSWGLNRVDEELLDKVLHLSDYRARAAAVRVVRYYGDKLKNRNALLREAVKDEHGRVRLEAILAASWLPDRETALDILKEAGQMPMDSWIAPTYETAMAHVQGTSVGELRKAEEEQPAETSLKGKDLELFTKGKAIYAREGFCNTCHQPDGKGLESSGFPPLSGTGWVNGSPERLIKLTLKGLMGPIEVQGKTYPGQVPMTPFEGLLNDEEVAAVLTYVRNSFGNQSSAITPEMVGKVRAETKDQEGFYHPAELLKEHPMEN